MGKEKSLENLGQGSLFPYLFPEDVERNSSEEFVRKHKAGQASLKEEVKALQAKLSQAEQENCQLKQQIVEMQKAIEALKLKADKYDELTTSKSALQN